MMKFVYIIIFFWCNICLAADLQIYFSPSNKCENNIVKMIDKSQHRIDVVMYAINNKDIVKALISAHKRGVKVRILTDRLQASNKNSKVMSLYDSGINIRVHSKNKIEHNKFAIFDSKNAVTGSYNWTEPASKKNSENCALFYRDNKTAKRYQNRFEYLWQMNTKKKSEAWFKRKRSN